MSEELNKNEELGEMRQEQIGEDAVVESNWAEVRLNAKNDICFCVANKYFKYIKLILLILYHLCHDYTSNDDNF